MATRTALAAIVLLAACQPSADHAAPISADSARTVITAMNQRWIRHVNANQPESLAAMYAFDGVALPPNRPYVTGRDSITALFRGLSAPGGVFSLTNENVMPAGPDDIYARGAYRYEIPAQGRTPAVTMTGRYMEHWRQRDGAWWLLENMWTTDEPPPAASR